MSRKKYDDQWSFDEDNFCYECDCFIEDCQCINDEDDDLYYEDLVSVFARNGCIIEESYEDEEEVYEQVFSPSLDTVITKKKTTKKTKKTYSHWSSSSRSYTSPFEDTRVKYFAFGSNMEASQMLTRCPDTIRIEGQYFLEGWELTFCGNSKKWGGGVATIVESQDGVVNGRLYDVSWGDIRRLDGFEGHPYVYKRQYVRLTDGTLALTYIKPVKSNQSAPSASYFKTIARGYQQVGFELDKLIDASII